MDDIRPSYYAVIPADVRYDDEIPPNAKLLYGEISALIGKDGFCFASNTYFMNLYGFSDPTVSRLLKKLEDNGYIIREQERDCSGKVVRRKIFLNVSALDEQPPLKNNTPKSQNREGGGIKNEGYTNTSITDIEKENKKEKAKALTDEQLHGLFVPWISGVAGEDWGRDDKNALYFALVGFYETRGDRKKEPARTKAAFTALSNRLARYSGGSPAVMVDMLERATTAGWKSVFPLGGDNGSRKQAPAQERQYVCV